VCGLEPLAFVTTVTPHMGEPGLKFVSPILGQTGHDIALRPRVGEPPLLFQMGTAPPFLLALRSFRCRRLYANVSGDVLVPFWTAVIQVGDGGDYSGDNNGVIARFFLRAARYKLESQHELLSVEQAGSPLIETPDSAALSLPGQLLAIEHGLNGCGWSKIAVKFKAGWLPHTWLPLSHARLVANERKGLTQLIAPLLHDGRVIMDDLASFLVSTIADASAITPRPLSAGRL